MSDNRETDGERPITTDDEIDRTGRDEQVAPGAGFGAPGAPPQTGTGLDKDDAPAEGVDSADFPGTGAP